MWDKIIHRLFRIPYVLNSVEFRSPKKPVATVILIHGIGSSTGMWIDTVKLLPRDVRIVAVDLLGFGLSPKPHWRTYSAYAQANNLIATMMRLRISGPIIIVGHSLGSLVAVEFARRYRIAVKSLVLVSPPFYKHDDSRKRYILQRRRILRAVHRTMDAHPGAAERLLKLISRYNLADKGFNPDNVDLPAYLTTLETAIINQTTLRDAKRLRCPIRIITGKLDPLVPERNISELAKTKDSIAWTSIIAAHELYGPMVPAVGDAIMDAIGDITGHRVKQ